jgi:hypothetical protein
VNGVYVEPGTCVYCKGRLSERAPGEPAGLGGATHSYCTLLHVVGHDVGLCGCTGYGGMDERAAAIECAARFNRETHW